MYIAFNGCVCVCVYSKLIAILNIFYISVFSRRVKLSSFTFLLWDIQSQRTMHTFSSYCA